MNERTNWQVGAAEISHMGGGGELPWAEFAGPEVTVLVRGLSSMLIQSTLSFERKV